MASLGEEITLIHAHDNNKEKRNGLDTRKLATKNGYRKKMERTICLKVSEGSSRPPVNRQATPAGS